MRAGDLAEVTVPIPTIFEPLSGDPIQVISNGDLVMLVKYEPTSWFTPCWLVIHRDQLGVISDRWLRTFVPRADRSDERWEAQTG